MWVTATGMATGSTFRCSVNNAVSMGQIMLQRVLECEEEGENEKRDDKEERTR